MKEGSHEIFSLRRIALIFLCSILAMSILMAVATPVSASENTAPSSQAPDGVDGSQHLCGDVENHLNASEKRCLAETYSPIIHFPREEKFRPTSVPRFIEKARIEESAASFEEDASIGTIADRDAQSRLILEDSDQYTDYGNSGLPRVVYVQVTDAEYEWDSYAAVTYWMFYFHDPKKGEGVADSITAHQADFESVTILVDNDAARYIGASQHYGGERRRWSAVETLNETHPHIYPSLGSHSIYFTNTEDRDTTILGQSQHLLPDDTSPDPVFNKWQDPVYTDSTGNHTIWKSGGRGLNTKDYDLRLLDGEELWLQYQGSYTRNWIRHVFGSNGQSPAHRTRWNNPGEWMDSILPYKEIAPPDAGWSFLTDRRGSINDTSVSVKPKIANEGALPATYWVSVTIEGSDGDEYGNETKVVYRDSGRVFTRLDWEETTISVAVSEVPDEVIAKVEIYRSPPEKAEAPETTLSTKICDGVTCRWDIWDYF